MKDVFAVTPKGVVWLTKDKLADEWLRFPSLAGCSRAQRETWHALTRLPQPMFQPVRIEQGVTPVVRLRSSSDSYEPPHIDGQELEAQLAHVGLRAGDVPAAFPSPGGSVAVAAVPLPAETGFRPLEELIASRNLASTPDLDLPPTMQLPLVGRVEARGRAWAKHGWGLPLLVAACLAGFGLVVTLSHGPFGTTPEREVGQSEDRSVAPSDPEQEDVGGRQPETATTHVSVAAPASGQHGCPATREAEREATRALLVALGEGTLSDQQLGGVLTARMSVDAQSGSTNREARGPELPPGSLPRLHDTRVLGCAEGHVEVTARAQMVAPLGCPATSCPIAAWGRGERMRAVYTTGVKGPDLLSFEQDIPQSQ